MNNPYKILGVPPNASAGEIKRAYRDLAKTYHPDVSTSSDASRRMQEVNDAYAVIGDPIKRAEYDQMQQMRATQPAQTPQARQAQAEHVCCNRCGKVDASLRVSTFTTVWSFVYFSFYKGWAYILCARCRTIVSLRFNLQVLLFGWWGIPWGPIFSIGALIKNSTGGHQPRENNAILLAIVGQNLINLGEYAEAEKALTASLRLKEDPAVIHLLQIAKSKSGYIRPEPVVKKFFRLEGHPVFYNTLLILLFCGIIALLTQAGSTLAKKPGAVTGASADATNPLPTITWWQKFMAKINLARGERWGLPIHIGDSRDHVYEILGNPAPANDAEIGLSQHLLKMNHPDQEVEFWPDKGLKVTFDKGTVLSIVAESNVNNTTVKAPYKGELAYGIHPGDNLATMLSHLGTPSKADTMSGYTWRFGNNEISEYILGQPITGAPNSTEKSYAVGDAWGGITIADIKSELEADDDAKREIARVTLTGQPLTPQEIYDKYKNRIYIVTCYDSHGTPTMLGTGFQFRDDLIVTNYHVVQDARKIMVKAISGMGQPEQIYVTEVSTLPKGASFLGSSNDDWAVLRPWGASKIRKLPPVETRSAPSPGEAVTVIGNPEGLDGSVTTGVVSAIRADNWVQISAPISHGSSGSPVFDSTGKWLGLATLMMADGQNLNFATPSEKIVGQVEQFVSPQGRMFMTATMPLRSMDLDPTFRAMANRSDKTPEEAQASITDIGNLLKTYQDPDDQSELLGDLIDIYTDNLNDYPSALAASKKRTEIDKDSYIAWQQQGNLLASKMGNTTDAKTCFQKAIDVAQNGISQDLAKNQKDFDDQEFQGESDEHHKLDLDQLQKSISLTQGSDAPYAVEIGRMYIQIGDTNDGRKWLEKAKTWASIGERAGAFTNGAQAEAARLLGIINQAPPQSPAPPQ